MLNIRDHGTGLALAGILLGITTAAQAGEGRMLFASVGDHTRSPIGWVEFCSTNPEACTKGFSQPRDIILTRTAWRDLEKVNDWVNDTIKPMTDQEHWGVAERWSLPTDGYGDCEDYVLLKRKLLIDAGWPTEALLITIVRDLKDEGHAVLTVKTDKGEYVLDNQNERVLLWADTGYRFVKRQSQSDPNVWVSLGDTRPAVATASAKRRNNTIRTH
ncbi:MAG: transglutaminase-like cysteine peptidase [Alphaproteobacteria bacterium]|nr:transglutaminase-like cysteine peptidase [Alphaproteobacteria bacterium]